MQRAEIFHSEEPHITSRGEEYEDQRPALEHDQIVEQQDERVDMSTQQGEYYLSDRAASSSDDEEHSVMMTFEWDNGYVFSVEGKFNPTWARDINHQNQNIDWSGPQGDVDQNMNGWH